MSDDIEYRVLLCPAGTTPETAVDTREFVWESSECDADVLRQEIIDHITSERIDSDIFYKYWRLYDVTPVDSVEPSQHQSPMSPVETFKSNLTKGTAPPFSSSGSAKRRAMSLYIMKNQMWVQRTLFPSSHVYNAFNNWLTQVKQTHSGVAQTSIAQRELHEATAQTLAAVDASFAASFDPTQPKHHNKALTLVGDNESEFISQLQSVLSNTP